MVSLPPGFKARNDLAYGYAEGPDGLLYSLADIPSGNGDQPDEVITAMPKTSWSPVDLAQILSGKYQEQPPTLLQRSDSAGLIYRGKVHLFQGEPEHLKGWVVQYGVAQVIRSGQNVVYIDFEDNPASIIERLEALGVVAGDLITNLHYT